MNHPVNLAPRQLEVLKLIASDMSCKQAADRMGVKFSTVDRVREKIKKKLNLHTSIQLTHYALHHKLVPNLFDKPTPP